MPAFCNQEHPFFWLSARTWLLMTLDRIASEQPEMLKPHVDFLHQQATECDPPHALQRHYAQQACMKLSKKYRQVYRRRELELLRTVNASPFPERRPRNKMGEHGFSDPALAHLTFDYHFDSMDTVPYWFSRITDLFAVPMDEIKTRAARWICDRWGFTEREVRDYSTTRGRYEDGDLTGHRHGDEPTIEGLARYLDWHAMMCVAGEMLDTVPLAEGRWEDDDLDFFEDFLKRWTPHFPDSWLADLLQPMPEEPFLHSLPSYADEDWDRRIPWEHYDRYLRASEETFPEMFVVSAYFEASNSSCWEHTRISSALVAPETAQSLLFALQTCENVWRYDLPELGERDSNLSSGPYRLEGWILEYQAHHGYTDDKDPLRRLLEMPLRKFGHQFLKFAGASGCQDPLDFRNGEGEGVGLFQLWDDMPQYRRSRDSLRGKRLLVNTELLLSYLKARQRCLIIECCVDRHKRREDRDDAPKRAKIYLLHPDGRLESLPKDPFAGEADRQRPGDDG